MIVRGDCLEVMRGMDANSIDAIVTDPPYGLKFMGKSWDHGLPGEPFWAETLRVAKPGCHLLAFGGTRTFHRLTCAIEDAGWEVRDCLMWVYGSGFPKSHNLKGDKDGWGTALKPAWEPIILARKPLDGTVAENVQKWGTGAINVDGCRVSHTEPIKLMKPQARGDLVYGQAGRHEPTTELKASGRWPANLIHDGSDEVLELFPNPHGAGVKRDLPSGVGNNYMGRGALSGIRIGDSGSAARFFYCAKASRKEREMGCAGEETTFQSGCGGAMPIDDDGKERDRFKVKAVNHHPTVKPLALMRYLCRLVTPPNGLILDPFCGSGSTGIAALQEGFRFTGIDNNAEYCEIAIKRLESL